MHVPAAATGHALAHLLAYMTAVLCCAAVGMIYKPSSLPLLPPGPLQAADGEPTAAAAPAASGASFAATDIGGGSAFAQPSGAVEARTPRALEVEGSAYSAPVPSSALRSRSLVQAVSAYLPGSPTGLDRLPIGAFWLHVGDGSQPAGHASTGGEGSEGGERMPATPPTTPLVRTAHGLSGI